MKAKILVITDDKAFAQSLVKLLGKINYQIFHPDKVPSNADSELKELAHKVFGKMTEAYDVLSDEKKKNKNPKK